MVVVLTSDCDTYLMSENEGRLSDGLSVMGASGAIHDVADSDGVDIENFHTLRGEPHVSKL